MYKVEDSLLCIRLSFINTHHVSDLKHFKQCISLLGFDYAYVNVLIYGFQPSKALTKKL